VDWPLSSSEPSQADVTSIVEASSVWSEVESKRRRLCITLAVAQTRPTPSAGIRSTRRRPRAPDLTRLGPTRAKRTQIASCASALDPGLRPRRVALFRTEPRGHALTRRSCPLFGQSRREQLARTTWPTAVHGLSGSSSRPRCRGALRLEQLREPQHNRPIAPCEQVPGSARLTKPDPLSHRLDSGASTQRRARQHPS
jgi:hypothetical protein